MKFIGLVGAGYWGKNLIREFNNHGALHTICDLDQEILKENKELYPQLNITNDWKSVLVNPEITAVCVSLPAELHYKFCKDALLHDKDVYVEKPLALSLDHCEELIKIAKESGKILMVGHLLQYHSCIKKIYEMIEQNYIGDIRYIVSNRFNLGKIRKEENVLWSFAPHDISVILRLMGNRLPKSVRCTGQSFISKNIHDITSTVLEYDNCYVQINVNWLNPFKEQLLTIVGTNGMITFDDTIKDKIRYYPNYMQWNQGQPLVNKQDGNVIKYDNTNSPLYIECGEFIRCCQKRQEPPTDGNEGMRVLSVLESAQKSLLSNGNSVVLNSSKYYLHPSSYLDSKAIIGKNTKVWHFCNIMESEIGENCSFGQNVFVAKGVKLGNNCRVQNNVSIYAGVTAEDNVFFGPSCVFTNDKNPRAKYSKNGKYIKTYIEEGVSIGANATIVCGIKIGKHSLIGAGAVVTKDVEPYSVMVGSPAKRVKTIDEYGNITPLNN